MADVSGEIPGRARELWSALERRIADLGSQVGAVDDDGWARICAAEGWPVALVACHITLGLRRQAGWVARVLAGRAPHAFDWDRTHALNARVSRRALSLRREDVLASLAAGASRWRALLADASDAALARPAFRYQDRERPIEWVAGALACRHIDEHVRSIRATLEGSTASGGPP